MRWAITPCLASILGLWAVLPAFAEEPAQGQRLRVPYQAQLSEGCGSAAISMVIRYWRQHSPDSPVPAPGVQEIHRQVYRPEAHGSAAVDVERFLNESGFRTFAFAGVWNDLAEHIAKGRPMIVALRSPGAVAQLHYVVVAGLSASHALIHDPARQPFLLMERKDFEKRWKASERWTLLALPAE